MSKLKKIALLIVSIITGCLFLYSAYTKVIPIQLFEYTIVDYLPVSWVTAAFATRIFIGLETALGLLIILKFYGKNKWILKTAFLLITLFSIYLFYLLATVGNNVNCGCFGDSVRMTPIEALIKNGFLLISLFLLIKYSNLWLQKWAKLIVPDVFFIILLLPFILFGFPDNQPDWLRNKKYQMNLSEISYIETQQPNQVLKQTEDKYIVAFLSPTCPHCKMAAYKMHLMHKKNPKLPFYFIIGGTKSDLSDFWNKSKASDIPYSRMERDPFLFYTHGSFPLIVFINKGWVVATAEYANLDQQIIEEWLMKDTN